MFGSKLVKLDEYFNKIWEIDINGGSYHQNQIISTTNGGFATTGQFKADQVFLQLYNSNGDEVSSFTYKHNEFPFNEGGSDLIQLDDMGFLIIGATRNLNEIADFDCYMIRTNSVGDTIWTRRFGDSTNDWLYRIISNNQNEFILQGDFTTDIPYSIIYKINIDGEVLDSVRMERFPKLVYSPLNYYIKVQNVDTSHVNLSKISPDKLFSLN